MNINTIHLCGRVTRDPEVRVTPSGAHVAKFNIATNHTWKDADGNKKEDVTFHNCVAFGRSAENIAKYVTKGQLFYVEGRQTHRTWEKDDGTKGYASEVVVSNFQFGPKPKGQEEGYRGARSADNDGWPDEEPGVPGDEINPDDIPF